MAETIKKAKNLSRCALSAFAAAFVLAGCGGSQGLTGVPGSIPRTGKVLFPDENHITRSVVSNHAFSAAYSGSHSCIIWYSTTTQSIFIGYGTASIPGFRTESKEIISRSPCNRKNAAFTLSSRSGQITGQITGRSCSPSTYTVTGGTGPYAGATGTGTITFTCPTKHHYKDKWSGTISY